MRQNRENLTATGKEIWKYKFYKKKITNKNKQVYKHYIKLRNAKGRSKQQGRISIMKTKKQNMGLCYEIRLWDAAEDKFRIKRNKRTYYRKINGIV